MKRVALLFLIPLLAGCLSEGEEPAETEAPTITKGVENVGTYYSIGASTFEPTIGITSDGGIFMTSYAGLGAGTNIRRSMDQGQTWDDATPELLPGSKPIPNSNDPYLYVDQITDRIYDFDMCLTLAGFCTSISDDNGDTWTFLGPATGYQPLLDHQTIAATPAPEGQTIGYPNYLTFCVNRGATVTGAWCSTSLDGGLLWTPLVPGFPVTVTQCSGLHGHVTGDIQGNFYRGNPSCDGPAVYKSADGGLTWTEHRIAPGTTVNGHEIATATDSVGNVYALWMSGNLPYLSVSFDGANSWTEPLLVAPEGAYQAGFPTIEAAAEGRAAFSFIAANQNVTEEQEWHGYIGLVDATGNVTYELVQVNDDLDPLDVRRACGLIRCGGFGDFIDIAIDAEGRPWAALAHNGHGDAGIVGTLRTGTSLWTGQPLSELPEGGASIWE